MRKKQITATQPVASNVLFFKSPAELRKWLAERHDKTPEVWVGFYKKGAAPTGLTYAEALDEALCFGWIDGLRKSVDATAYKIRFTPRKARSIWSRVNTRRAGELKKLGRMSPAGLKAFEAREARRIGIYSFENAPRELAGADRDKFRADRRAWEFFESQPPGYRRTAIWWVISAKREETRQRRLATLMEDSRNGRRIALLARPTKPSSD
jgi:uncharacterized protein YdeI (YjbR/CyaY-like superfamily)